MDIYENITVIHQQVREFVEREIPNYYVKQIIGETVAHYSLPADNAPPLVLSYTSLKFHILAWRPIGEVTCTVYVLDDGTFRLDDTRFLTRV